MVVTNFRHNPVLPQSACPRQPTKAFEVALHHCLIQQEMTRQSWNCALLTLTHQLILACPALSSGTRPKADKDEAPYSLWHHLHWRSISWPAPHATTQKESKIMLPLHSSSACALPQVSPWGNLSVAMQAPFPYFGGSPVFQPRMNWASGLSCWALLVHSSMAFVSSLATPCTTHRKLSHEK